MLTVRGIFENGKIQLLEPVDVKEPHYVAVTFLDRVPETELLGSGEKEPEALALIGLLSDLTPEEEERFDEAVKHSRPFFGPREVGL